MISTKDDYTSWALEYSLNCSLLVEPRNGCHTHASSHRGQSIKSSFLFLVINSFAIYICYAYRVLKCLLSGAA